MSEEKDHKNAKVQYYEGDPQECDMCDKSASTVVIETLGGDGLVICKECLEKIVGGFDDA